ncbi:MAG: FAD:protein FMN transferase [Bacteroidia bacterium]|nr:FAD:protein FMN transferase [Bacteroidia bacterium]
MRLNANIPKVCAIIYATCLMNACGPPDTGSGLFETDGFYNGMVYHVLYHDTLRRDLAQEIDSIVWSYAASMSPDDTNSVLFRLNHNDTTLILTETMIRAVRNQKVADSITGGYLPLTTGALKERWGLNYKKLKPGWREPSPEELDSLLREMRNRDVALYVRDFTPRQVGEEQRNADQKFWLENIRLRRSAMIDPEALCRGLLTDLISEYLELEGISDYSVQVDKVIRTSGRMKNKPWKVGFERPELSDDIFYESTIELGDASVATSGFTRKAVSTPGGDYLPVIHPFTGKPVPFSFISFSVIAEDATSADLYSHALAGMGIEQAMAFAQKHGWEIYIVEKTESGDFRTHSTLKKSRNRQSKE